MSRSSRAACHIGRPARSAGCDQTTTRRSARMATFSGCFRTERRFAMAETRATEKGRAQKSTNGAATNRKSSGFTAEERAAMKERARELKAEARMTKNRAAGESAVLVKIAEMPQPDRAKAERLHAIITA